MSPADEAFVSTVAATVAAVAALISVVVGTVNVVFARKLLTESRATIKELKKLQQEGQGTIDELRKLTTAAHAEAQAERATTFTLRMILTEAQAARELELLGNIASDVYRISSLTINMGRSTAPPGAWPEFQSGQRLLGAHVAGLPAGELQACRFLASPQADPSL
jgi:predicted PurR-regulated permease PerM